MENIIREKTHFTPRMSFNADTGVFEMSGRSMPEVAMNIYKPVMEWLDEYIANPQKETKIIFKLIFFNTSSSKYIMEMLKKLESLHKKGYSVKAVWYCEDDDIFELAKDYQMLVKIPMEILQTEEQSELK